MSLKLPKNTSLQDLYLEEDQTIWFLIWILKKAMPCDRYISEIILETPFRVIRDKKSGIPRQYILKNGRQHGPDRWWYENRQLRYEMNWKNGEKHGQDRWWYMNGQVWYEWNWKNGQRHGLARGWYDTGQLRQETHWKKWKKHGLEREWHENGQIYNEKNWENLSHYNGIHICAVPSNRFL